jgi:AbiV family abortive infection protein
MNRRRFRSTTKQVVEAVRACLTNAIDLSRAASEQNQQGRPGLGIALSVLALEELGKLILTDGLAFAQPGDERANRFESALRGHKTKLEVLDLFPFWVPYFAGLDERFSSERPRQTRHRNSCEERHGYPRRAQEVARSGVGVHRPRSVEAAGFLRAPMERTHLVAPNSTLDPQLAAKLTTLACQLVNLVDFPLRDSFDRYEDMLASIRSAWSESEYRIVQRRVEEALDEMFRDAENGYGG